MLILEQVERTYLKEGSYSGAAKTLGVSKQRVDQILRRSQNPVVLALKATKRQKNYTSVCLECKRSFSTVGVTHISRGICIACYNYLRSSSPHTKIRQILYPKNCKVCKTSIVKKRHCRGMCITCYNHIYITSTPEYKLRRRRYQQENKEKLNAYARLHYKNNIEHYRKYYRDWYHKNPKNMKAYYKQYYAKNKVIILANQKRYRQRLKLDKLQAT